MPKQKPRALIATILESQNKTLRKMGKDLAELARIDHKPGDEENIVGILGAIRLLEGTITKLKSED